MVGVSSGFEKKLTLIGVGYRAAVEGTKKLTLALGYSHPVEMPIPAGLTVKARGARAGWAPARRRTLLLDRLLLCRVSAAPPG